MTETRPDVTALPGTSPAESFEVPASAAALEGAVERVIEALDRAVDALEADDRPAAIETVLRPFDALQVGESDLGAWCHLMAVAHPDAPLREAAMTLVRRFVDLSNRIDLSRAIYDRLAAMDLSGADDVTRFYVDKTLRRYRDAGVDRDEERRDRVQTLRQKAFTLGQTFDRLIRETVGEVYVDDPQRLAGLPQDYLDRHPPDERGRVRISTERHDYLPVMTYAEDDELRRDLRRTDGLRCYPENHHTLRDLLRRRRDLAEALDYPTYAHLALADKMAGTPERVAAFLDELRRLVRPLAEREYEMLLDELRRTDPTAEVLQPWQRSFALERLRRRRFGVDARELRRFFRYDRVRDGIFHIVEQLFGVEIRPWETPCWHPSVTAHALYDQGEPIGFFYLDMFPRPGKLKSGAHIGLRRGVRGGQRPVSALIANMPGDLNRPGFLEWSQVKTFFHEFGHLLHGLFSGGQPWAGIGGMSMERDFVEVPSQLFEVWMEDYESVTSFAVDDEGRRLDRESFEAMIASRRLGLATHTVVQLYLAALSLELYLADPDSVDFDEVERRLYRTYVPGPAMEDDHMAPHFGHLNGYACSYYTYQWSKAIVAEIAEEFRAAGMMNRALAQRYRKEILAAAGSRPAEESVRAFLGRTWSPEAYRRALLRAEVAPVGG